MIDYISSLPSSSWETARPRTLCILGCTGSIGVNGLRVVASHRDMFSVTALAAGRNVALLAEQAAVWRPGYLGVVDEPAAEALRALLPKGYRPCIMVGPLGYARLASLPECSTVLAAQVGKAGLIGTVSAVLAGKVVCLANKESLVLAGDLLRGLCRSTGAVILPVDSEHDAVFQAVHRREDQVRRIIITASGGPFRGRDRAFLASVTPEMALNHPNWKMGPKVTVDSATLMNKGLEVIEAHHLFGVPVEEIGVLVHPRSLVHALAEYRDGSLFAHMGTPDMRMPIAHCLLWPLCDDVGVAPLDLAAAGTVTFEKPDTGTFPCLALAYRAMAAGADACAAMNAANEVAVRLFLDGRIPFTGIPELIGRAIGRAGVYADSAPLVMAPDVPPFLRSFPGASRAFDRLSVIDHIDAEARREALQRIGS